AFGNLFVSRKSESSNASDGVILKFTPDGKSSVFVSNISHPKGLAFDSLGNLYLAYPDHNSILKFTRDGSRTTFASGIGHPYRLAFDASGNLLVTDPTANSIFEISQSGVVSTLATNTSTPDHVSNCGISNPLQAPTLELHDSTGKVIATNGDWQTATNAGQIPVDFRPADMREPAILATLQPGTFTAVLRGKSGGTGVGLIEMDDLSTGVPSKLTNVSTRGFVGTEENVMIGGFILSG